MARRTGAGPHLQLQHVCRRWPARKSLSIRPFAPSDNFTSALTSAFTRVDDDLVFAGTKGGYKHADLRISDPLDRPGHQELQGLAESRGGFHDETATAALLRVGSLGSIRSNTMRAFSADEMTTIIGKTG